MKAKNPSKREDVREKISLSLREMNHRPQVRGGNGRGMTEPQRRLTNRLRGCGLYVEDEYIIPTHQPRSAGFPTHYKIDIAIPSVMAAIEIDGGSHGSLKVQAADAKKTAFLNGLGWKVLRFTNKSVMEDMDGCVRAVMSII